MNAKLCKRLRKQARDESPIGTPARRLIRGTGGSLAGNAINGPGTTRGVYRQLKRENR